MDLATLGMIALLGVVGYFMIIRPQQKRAKEQQSLMKALEPGTRVMLSSGLFGTIRHLGEKQVVVEVSPGVEMTFVKQAIVRPLKDDEDEFEYDEAASGNTAVAVTDWDQPPASEAPLQADEVVEAPVADTTASGEPTAKAADQG